MSNYYRDNIPLCGKFRTEIDCSLHYRCSNGCDFCFAHGVPVTPTIDLEVIRKMADSTLKYFYSDTVQKTKRCIFRVMGGELFEGNLSDELWEAYRYFFNTCLDNAEKASIKINFYIITNLLYKTENLYKAFTLIDELNTRCPGVIDMFGTSFDLWGRFKTKERLRLWQNNFEILLLENKKRGIKACGEIVLTKQAYEILRTRPEDKRDEIECFEYLYTLVKNKVAEFDIVKFQYTGYASNSLIKDTDKAEMYKWLIKNYPLFGECQVFLHRIRQTACYGGQVGWFGDDLDLIENVCAYYNFGRCQDLSPELSEEEAIQKNLIVSDNRGLNFDQVFEAYINKFGCTMCKHWPYCKLECTVDWNLKVTHTDPNSSYCWIKDVYDFVEKEGLFIQ